MLEWPWNAALTVAALAAADLALAVLAGAFLRAGQPPAERRPLGGPRPVRRTSSPDPSDPWYGLY